MRASLAAVTLLVAVAGCTSPGLVLEDAPAAVPLAAALRLDGLAYDAVPGYVWKGDLNKALSKSFTIELEEGFWDKHQGALEVSVVWAHNGTADYTVLLQDAGGKTIVAGTNGWYASVATLADAKPGAYAVKIQPVSGSIVTKSQFEAIIQLDVTPKLKPTGAQRLPNLVTIPPVDLQIFYQGLYEATGYNPATRGCGLDETAEHRAMRCLRVSNGVGNIGEGPLEVRLSLGEAAKAPAGMGVWMQRIYKDDGSVQEVPVGNAVFHATHGHWHYSGLAKFDLYKYDLATKARGDHVGKSNKNGFCFFDIGLVVLGLPNTVMKRYSGEACLAPEEQQQAWFMGLSPNWFDFYHWNLPDQYVEITGLPDGVYELVSTASGAGLLHESDKTDNSASAVVRITGDKVQTLDSWSDYQK